MSEEGLDQQDFNDFADAVRRKLILEISGLSGGSILADAAGVILR